MRQNLEGKSISLRKASFYCLVILILSFAAGFLLERNVFSEVFKEKEKLPSVYGIGEGFFEETLFSKVKSELHKKYVGQPVDEKKLFYGALKGMTESLEDPYSVFLDPEEMTKFQETMSGEFEGVGIEIGIKDEVLTVIAPLAGTPAEKAGVKAGDKIYAINGQSTAGISLDQAVNKIRGKEGTSVVLTIWREGFKEPKDFEIKRGLIKIRSVEWEKKEEGIAYLKISHFSDNTWNEFKKIAAEILKMKPKALILDLRNNPGGYLEGAVDIAGYWLGQDTVCYSEDAQKQRKEYRANGRGEFADLKTVVLINEGSASGAEILAGALKDYKKAILIGKKTFGKGSVQDLEIYPDGSGLKLTVAYWLTPNNFVINEVGVEPEIEVEMTGEDLENKKDSQLLKALEYLK